MQMFQVFNSRIQKHGSFEDLFIQLSKSAYEKKIKVSFVFPDVETMEVKKEILFYQNTEVFVIKNNWSSIKFLGNFLKLAFRENPQILDFHFCYSINFALLFLFFRILGKKVIYHYHGEIKPIQDLRFINRHFSKLRTLTFFANKIICVSQANKKFLEALNIKNNIYVIYNGVNTENFLNLNINEAFQRTINFNNGEIIVTSIGSLIPRKGIDVLIRAAEQVIREIPEVKFIVVGGGDKEKYQNLVRELGISDKVIFTGLLKEYPYNILKATDLYVSASYAESFGLSIAEAQLLGIPVVATRVGGVPEVVIDGKTGKLVAPGDSKGLAKEIICLLKNKRVRDEYGRNGKDWIREHFDLKAVVGELLDVCSN